MSSEALAWAFKQDVKPSSVKFVLVALCECAHYQTGLIHPSIDHICEITGLNRKTAIAAVAELERLGLLTDTGDRVGRTRQIKVYRAEIGTVPKAERFQKRNSSTFTRKESQKRDMEPSREPSTLDTSNEVSLPRSKKAVSGKRGVAAKDRPQPVAKPQPRPNPMPDAPSGSAAAPDADAPLTSAEILGAWNHMALECGLPEAKKLTAERERRLAARCRDFDINDWTEAIRAVRRSPFLRGDNDRGWRANFDWLLQPRSLTKLIEGQYDQKPSDRSRK